MMNGYSSGFPFPFAPHKHRPWANKWCWRSSNSLMLPDHFRIISQSICLSPNSIRN
jgi:hypothetical protein